MSSSHSSPRKNAHKAVPRHLVQEHKKATSSMPTKQHVTSRKQKRKAPPSTLTSNAAAIKESKRSLEGAPRQQSERDVSQERPFNWGGSVCFAASSVAGSRNCEPEQKAQALLNKRFVRVSPYEYTENGLVCAEDGEFLFENLSNILDSLEHIEQCDDEYKENVKAGFCSLENYRSNPTQDFFKRVVDARAFLQETDVLWDEGWTSPGVFRPQIMTHGFPDYLLLMMIRPELIARASSKELTDIFSLRTTYNRDRNILYHFKNAVAHLDKHQEFAVLHKRPGKAFQTIAGRKRALFIVRVHWAMKLCLFEGFDDDIWGCAASNGVDTSPNHKKMSSLQLKVWDCFKMLADAASITPDPSETADQATIESHAACYDHDDDNASAKSFGNEQKQSAENHQLAQGDNGKTDSNNASVASHTACFDHDDDDDDPSAKSFGERRRSTENHRLVEGKQGVVGANGVNESCSMSVDIPTMIESLRNMESQREIMKEQIKQQNEQLEARSEQISVQRKEIYALRGELAKLRDEKKDADEKAIKLKEENKQVAALRDENIKLKRSNELMRQASVLMQEACQQSETPSI